MNCEGTDPAGAFGASGPTPPRPGRTVPSAVLLLALLVSGCGVSAKPASVESRQEQIARNGASVMPFDLERTTHRFTPAADGLLEEVVSDAPTDAEQIRLIREHLTHEAQRFRQGDYADPARIHGAAMPGLQELSAGVARIEITSTERPDGAAVRFRTSDAALVKALHAWGAAQTSDHGAHADQ
ncbi:aspartate carbamoyltransferase [Streptomyces sp. NPDC003038]|uniref:aspartate carbamoyltransferase n=1 Tax=unclassified Streptomyces TaxID=2593676 RepID=UPI0033BC0360